MKEVWGLIELKWQTDWQVVEKLWFVYMVIIVFYVAVVLWKNL